jgi:hypothetical protein
LWLADTAGSVDVGLRPRRYLVKVHALALVLGVVVLSGPARAHDAYDDSQSHPLRVAAYLAHPVGWALEWMLARPFHFLVSEPGNETIFGHEAHESPFGAYEPYQHDLDRPDPDADR